MARMARRLTGGDRCPPRLGVGGRDLAAVSAREAVVEGPWCRSSDLVQGWGGRSHSGMAGLGAWSGRWGAGARDAGAERGRGWGHAMEVTVRVGFPGAVQVAPSAGIAVQSAAASLEPADRGGVRLLDQAVRPVLRPPASRRSGGRGRAALPEPPSGGRSARCSFCVGTWSVEGWRRWGRRSTRSPSSFQPTGEFGLFGSGKPFATTNLGRTAPCGLPKRS